MPELIFYFKIFCSPEQCASRVVDIIKNAPNGSIWVVEGGEPAYQFVIPHRNTFKL